MMYLYCFILEQCPHLPSPKHGSVDVTLKVNEVGALYSAQYHCESDYTLVGGNSILSSHTRTCNPKERSVINNMVGRPRYSGEAPLCKGKHHTFSK